VAWVGIAALIRGVTEIIFAFKLRNLHQALAGGGPALAT
jgi:uncharacterized membrane protein HdeD (DUF308 family)